MNECEKQAGERERERERDGEGEYSPPRRYRRGGRSCVEVLWLRREGKEERPFCVIRGEFSLLSPLGIVQREREGGVQRLRPTVPITFGEKRLCEIG